MTPLSPGRARRPRPGAPPAAYRTGSRRVDPKDRRARRTDVAVASPIERSTRMVADVVVR